MKYNTLPNTDLTVSKLCFGCWGIIPDFHWGERDQQDSVKAILATVDAGINFFDTAPVYGDGASETLLGTVFADHKLRDKTIIASKVPPNSMKPDQIQTECEASLKRLQTDYLDLYQTHWTSRDVPLADSWGAMLRLQEQGKVRHIGVCNMGLEDLQAVSDLQKPVTNQLPFNLMWRMIEAEILPHCIQQDIGVLVYTPLMHGILADKYQSAADVPDGRARSRHFNGERPMARHGEPGAEVETFAALDAIRDICVGLNREMADVALAWIMQQAGIVSVITGASNADQLRKNVNAVESPLSDDVLQKLDAATTKLKTVLGSNPDMWDGGENSRYR
jgi:aryl-alcohol dehydrogenase-like predicted oxidoreductase